MSNRTLRINELVQREISAYLHTRYQGEAVRIPITAVVVSPALRDARGGRAHGRVALPRACNSRSF